MSAHLPQRPSWICLACASEWPCEPARDGLLEEFRYDQTSLRIYLSQQMLDAIAHLGGTPGFSAMVIFNRFLAWAKPADHEAPPEWSRTARSI
jgi:hypothetical protein